MRHTIAATTLLILATFGSTTAQDKKPADKKVAPKVMVVLPLGMMPGSTEKLTIRGMNLDNATEVRFAGEVATAKITSKGKAGVPDKNPEKVGDTQVVVEVKLTDKIAENPTFTVVTPDGETKPHVLLVETSRPVVKEMEPNDGFQKPQDLKQLPVVIEGAIERVRDVDVFAFAGKKGQKLRAELLAARHGSALDPQLTLFRGASIQIDVPVKFVSGDALIEAELTHDDRYYLVVNDALDTGSAIHAYRLVMELK